MGPRSFLSNTQSLAFCIGLFHPTIPSPFWLGVVWNHLVVIYPFWNSSSPASDSWRRTPWATPCMWFFFQRKNASQHSKINFDCRQSFPIKMWLFILGFPQYFMNISVKNYSNKMILYNFKQPAERAVLKCPKLFLTVLPEPRNSRNKSGKSFAGHPV